jgi:hypothetical protein
MRTAILVAMAVVLVSRAAIATTVTNLNDSGDGSLRAAVAATLPGGVVDFAPGLTGTIMLASPIDVNGLTISAPGASALRLSGGNATPLLAMTGATTLEGLTIADGLATDELTGAVTYAVGSGPHVLRDCRVQDNHSTASVAAAVLAFSTLTVERCTFSGNVGASAGGTLAGAFGTDSIELTVRDTVFTDNESGVSGGGILLLAAESGTVSATVIRSAFADNRAQAGDAIGLSTGGAGAAHATLANSTVLDTAAAITTSVAIGAASSGSAATTVDVVNATFHVPGANRAALGGTGAGTVMTVTNSIVSGGEFPACFSANGAVLVNGGHNIATSTTCGLGPAADPKLDPAGLVDHGGLTPTIALLDDSPARDAGGAAACAAPPVDGVDQRGVARPIGAQCDIGAFEAPTTTTTTTTLPPETCDAAVTVSATRCRLEAVRAAIATEVPAGALQQKLDRLVGSTLDRLDLFESLRAAGNTKAARATLRKGSAALGRLRKAIKAKAAKKALTADQRSQLTDMVKRLQQDLRLLKG